ncbi:hypothetical protein [Mycobacterium sp.]|uniref:hypothetical protein n=1 Tax=Mycobacterium sp. TaxID=1785 RepID=UPI002621C08D|nr:hypothetical protein [Mycobacterium sp.]
MSLDYRIQRIGKVWRASLKRPGNDRPLFYESDTKHGALAALLTGVGRMSATPERLWGKDWTVAANERAAAARSGSN